MQIARAFDAEIHLLLCDVHLPGASGYRAAEQLRELRPSAKVLFMSGHMDLSIPEAERSPTVTAFQTLQVFPKPFSVEQLALAVRDTLDASEAPAAIEEVFA
jgi:DNA-binding NarL/FixJ family response regulator